MISAQSFPEFLASNIPTDRPSFTTPSLDFATHSVELQRHLEQIYYLRDSYFDLFPIREKDVHLVESRKNERILKAIERVLERLNLLTKPPKKKKKSCKKEMKGSSDNSSSESLSEDSKADNNLNGSNDSRASLSQKPNPNLPRITSTHNFDPTLSSEQKAFYHYLRGHLFNVISIFNYPAEDNLSRAVKLNPKLREAWTSLGTCLWKKGDVDAAKRCYENSLETEADREANWEGLRYLSMLLRQMGSTPQERREHIEHSVDISREVVRRRPDSGLGWFGLGNAYSSLFFSVSFLQSDLLKSLKCLNKSLTFPPCAQHADIYYSRGSLHHYMENYLPALEDYERALKLDPTIMSGNAVGVVGILGYLGRVEDAVIKKAYIKPKNLEPILQSLANDLPNLTFTVEKQQKPYTLAHIPSLATTTYHTGKTENKLLAVKVKLIGEIMTGYVMRGFVGIDSEGNCFGVSVFNIGPETMKVGDEIIIGNPEVIEVDVSWKGARIRFKSLRVDNPLMCLIDGKRIETNEVAWTEMKLNPTDS